MDKEEVNSKYVISVCFGSSCHLKGAFAIAERIKKFLKEHNLENKFELRGALCMGQCTNSVNITISGETVSNLSTDKLEELDFVLTKLILNKGDNYDIK
ncbi:MAG: NAD(P)H-dependent oxidoreductase subunit E [Fervidobacterium sp.]|nr:NAD(P)H-dependent oxidoreductase subunit E [Fervidobacterium sp.]